MEDAIALREAPTLDVAREARRPENASVCKPATKTWAHQRTAGEEEQGWTM